MAWPRQPIEFHSQTGIWTWAEICSRLMLSFSFTRVSAGLFSAHAKLNNLYQIDGSNTPNSQLFSLSYVSLGINVIPAFPRDNLYSCLKSSYLYVLEHQSFIECNGPSLFQEFTETTTPTPLYWLNFEWTVHAMLGSSLPQAFHSSPMLCPCPSSTIFPQFLAQGQHRLIYSN